MKRLIKKAELLTLYHGTSAYNYNKIISQEGLDHAYLTDRKVTAEYYAKEKKANGGGYPVVLTINIDKDELTNLGKVYVDSNLEYVTNESSPEGKRIKDWTESLHELHSIYFIGTIPPQYIISVENLDGSPYIEDPNHNKEIYNTNYKSDEFNSEEYYYEDYF